MTTTQSTPGLVYQNEACTILDTRAMDWESFGPGGASAKVLSRFETGEPRVLLWRTLPGNIQGPGHRHYHRTVHEFHYWVEGEYPIFEYESPDELYGRQLVLRQGWYLGRLPGPKGIHGRGPAVEGGPDQNIQVSRVGSQVLMWRTGPDNLISEPGADWETPEVPFPENATGTNAEIPTLPPPRAPGRVYENDAVTILDTREMQWEPWGSGQKIKVLERFETGEPKVFIVWFPPGHHAGERAHDAPYRHYHQTVTECHLWLDGEFPIFEYESPDEKNGRLFRLRQGHYLERKPGPAGIHGVYEGEETKVVSKVGSTVLVWRDGTGNFTHEPNGHEESVEVPFPD
jgi:hypothetical protein